MTLDAACMLAEASILSPGILGRWVLLNGICLPLFTATLPPATGGGPVQGQAQGGVFSFMAAASWAFCSLYFRIFRWRL